MAQEVGPGLGQCTLLQ
nr:hypothetical protein [Marinobacter sediminum]